VVGSRGAHTHSSQQQQQQQGANGVCVHFGDSSVLTENGHLSKVNDRASDSSTGSGSVGGGSPVKNACKTLPRLQLNRSSFEGVRDVDDPGTQADPGASGASAAAAAAAGGGVYQGRYQSPSGLDGISAHQQYQQQQQYGGAIGRSRLGGAVPPAEVAAGIQMQRQQQQHSFMDPEHLIVNGMGGAFMHPTHVFSYSRFAVLDDEAATATAAIYSSAGPNR
jgi:hypothetical protein